MIHELVRTRNDECAHCAAVCDEAFRQKHYAYGELEDGTLYIDTRDSTGKRDPGGIIPALHLLEYYHSLKYKPEQVVLTRFEGDLTGSDAKEENGYRVTDISGEAPENQTYLIIKNGVGAEDLLNTYNSMLNNASERNIQIKFPRDVLIKTASSEEISALKRAIGYYSNYAHHDELNGVDIGLLQEDLNGGYSVMRRIKELPMYHIREKVELYKDVLELFNGDYSGRPLSKEEKTPSNPQNLFNILSATDNGRMDPRRKKLY